MESNKKDQSIDTQANTVVKQADIIANLQKQLSWLSKFKSCFKERR